jgi:hypothetical protein
MAIFVDAHNPHGLVAAIKKDIDRGHIETWKYDKDGDFTHSPPQWENRAWLRPYVIGGSLKFGIIFPTNAGRNSVVYAVYHGRFIEMLLSHFDSSFSMATASAVLVHPDKF